MADRVPYTACRKILKLSRLSVKVVQSAAFGTYPQIIFVIFDDLTCNFLAESCTIVLCFIVTITKMIWTEKIYSPVKCSNPDRTRFISVHRYDGICAKAQVAFRVTFNGCEILGNRGNPFSLR